MKKKLTISVRLLALSLILVLATHSALAEGSALDQILNAMETPQPEIVGPITGKSETDKLIREVAQPRVKSDSDKQEIIKNSIGQKYKEVEGALGDTITGKITDAASLSKFIKEPPVSDRDRGVENPQETWNAIATFLGNEQRFYYWADMAPISSNCACSCSMAAPSIPGIDSPPLTFPAAMWEYWFPYAVVEVTEQPLKTAFFSNTEISMVISDYLEIFNNPYNVGAGGQELYNTWTLRGVQRAQDAIDKYIFPTLLPDAPMPTIPPASGASEQAKQLALGGIQSLNDSQKVKLPDGKEEHLKLRYRNPFGVTEGRSFTEFRAIPLKKEITDALYDRYPQVCHFKLATGNANPLQADAATFGNLGVTTAQFLGTSTVVASDFPTGALDIVRHPEGSFLLQGRDRLRTKVQYDAQMPGGANEFWQSFNNAGSIEAMFWNLSNNPMQCTQMNMGAFDRDGNQRSVSDPRSSSKTLNPHTRLNTPDDIFSDPATGKTLSALEAKIVTDPVQVAASGCLQSNLGPWVPIRNYVNNAYHATAAQVAAIRALKLAYYLHPPEGVCVGDTTSAPNDQWGLAGCFFRGAGGHFYDFNPFPYADSHTFHPYSAGVVWQPSASAVSGNPINPTATFGGNFNRVSDKLQWFAGGLVPREEKDQDRTPDSPQQNFLMMEDQMALGIKPSLNMNIFEPDQVSRSAIEKLDQRPLGADGKLAGPHHIAIAWRFFRSCPKDLLTGDCCQPCCAPYCGCCPIEKKL